MKFSSPQPLHLPSLPHAHKNRLSLTTHHTSTIATLILSAELHRIHCDPAAKGMAISTGVSSRRNLHFRLVFSWSPAVSTVMALRNMNFSPGRLSNSRLSLGSKLAKDSSNETGFKIKLNSETVFNAALLPSLVLSVLTVVAGFLQVSPPKNYSTPLSSFLTAPFLLGGKEKKTNPEIVALAVVSLQMKEASKWKMRYFMTCDFQVSLLTSTSLQPAAQWTNQGLHCHSCVLQKFHKSPRICSRRINKNTKQG